jgi:hypothetical protein
LIAEIDAATDRDSLLVEERIKTLRNLLEDTDRRISVYMRELQRSRKGEAMYASLGMGIRAALDSHSDTEETPTPKETPTPREMPTPRETPTPKETQVLQIPTLQEIQVSQEKSETNVDSTAAANAKPAAKKRNTGKRRTKIPSDEEGPSAKPKLRVQIAEMADQGLSTQEIASKLHLSIAEVELALNLLNHNIKQ